MKRLTTAGNGKLILNKNVASAGDGTYNKFTSNTELRLKEIVVCNDNETPGLYIMKNNGEIQLIAPMKVSSSDGSLNIENNEISANLGLAYNETKNEIELKGKDELSSLSSVPVEKFKSAGITVIDETESLPEGIKKPGTYIKVDLLNGETPETKYFEISPYATKEDLKTINNMILNAEAYATFSDDGSVSATVDGSGNKFVFSFKIPKGEKGNDGADGATGPQGPMGPQGPAGQDGKDGTIGPQGPAGADGKDGQNGKDGVDGQPGAPGESAYETYKRLNPEYQGNEEEWLSSLKGEPGQDGQPGKDGVDGQPGTNGQNGKDGITPHIGDNGNWFIGEIDQQKPSRGEPGKDGKDGTGIAIKPSKQDCKELGDAYIDQSNGHIMILTELPDTFIDGGQVKGDPGKNGVDGQPGKDGAPGQDGQNGKDGVDGKSAYELAGGDETWGSVDNWLASLKGDKGDDSTVAGPRGYSIIEVSASGAETTTGNAYNIYSNEPYNGENKKLLKTIYAPKGDKGDDSTVPGPQGYSISQILPYNSNTEVKNGNAYNIYSEKPDEKGNETLLRTIYAPKGGSIASINLIPADESHPETTSNDNFNMYEMSRYVTGDSGDTKTIDGTIEIPKPHIDKVTGEWYVGDSSTNIQSHGVLSRTGSDSELELIGVTKDTEETKTYTPNNIYVGDGKMHALNGFFENSDERLKDFGEEVTVDFDKLAQIPKIHYTWVDDDFRENQIGTSAQKVQELYPELVDENKNGYLSVDYAKLSIIALKAIDELHKEIEELKKQIKK